MSKCIYSSLQYNLWLIQEMHLSGESEALCPNLFQHNQKHLISIPSQRGHSVTLSFRQSDRFLDTSTKLFWFVQQDEALSRFSDVAQKEPHTEEAWHMFFVKTLLSFLFCSSGFLGSDQHARISTGLHLSIFNFPVEVVVSFINIISCYNSRVAGRTNCISRQCLLYLECCSTGSEQAIPVTALMSLSSQSQHTEVPSLRTCRHVS